MILIKLGGSVITDKSRYRTFRRERTARLCREIAASGRDAVVVHGAGSFGHVLAKRHGLSSGFSDPSQIPAVAQVCHDVRELSSMVVGELNAAGLPAVSVPTGSCFMMDGGRLEIGDASVLKGMRRIGLMPVMFGDIVLDRERGFGICSGDQIVKLLADALSAEQVVFVSDVDGLFASDPKRNPGAELYREVDARILEGVRADPGVDDVTGGVRAKMEIMLGMCSGDRDCVLVNGAEEGRLLSLLRGEDVPCTVAKGTVQ